MSTDEPKDGSKDTARRGIQAALQAYLDEAQQPLETSDQDDAWDDIEDFLHAIDDSLAAFDAESLDDDVASGTDMGVPASGTYPDRGGPNAPPPLPFADESDEEDEGGGTHHGVPAADLARDIAALEASRAAQRDPDPAPDDFASVDTGDTMSGIRMGTVPPLDPEVPVVVEDDEDAPDQEEVDAWDAYAEGAPAELDQAPKVGTISGVLPMGDQDTPTTYDVPTAVSAEVPKELLRSLHPDPAEDTGDLDARRREAEQREAERQEAARQETLRREAEHRERLRREAEARDFERKREAERREAERRAQRERALAEQRQREEQRASYEARQQMLREEIEHREMLRRQELLRQHQSEVQRSRRTQQIEPPTPARPETVTPVTPPDAPAEPSFEDIKNDALEALLDRELDRALALFKKAHEMEPDDIKVRANLDRLAALGYQ